MSDEIITSPVPLDRLDAIDARLNAGDERMARIEKCLSANSEATQRSESKIDGLVEGMSGLNEAWNAMSGAWKVFNWIGKAAKPLAYIVGAITAVIAMITAIKGGSPRQHLDARSLVPKLIAGCPGPARCEWAAEREVRDSNILGGGCMSTNQFQTGLSSPISSSASQ